jgi:hypothetical protein
MAFLNIIMGYGYGFPNKERDRAKALWSCIALGTAPPEVLLNYRHHDHGRRLVHTEQYNAHS